MFDNVNNGTKYKIALGFYSGLWFWNLTSVFTMFSAMDPLKYLVGCIALAACIGQGWAIQVTVANRNNPVYKLKIKKNMEAYFNRVENLPPNSGIGIKTENHVNVCVDKNGGDIDKVNNVDDSSKLALPYIDPWKYSNNKLREKITKLLIFS